MFIRLVTVFLVLALIPSITASSDLGALYAESALRQQIWAALRLYLLFFENMRARKGVEYANNQALLAAEFYIQRYGSERFNESIDTLKELFYLSYVGSGDMSAQFMVNAAHGFLENVRKTVLKKIESLVPKK
ncbi:MAG TPA: hypothetical protein VMW09_10265 [Desulfatiglandales bacterium]|nr:hypothetical protein [Desulfatiglandales bacterium]